jgi:hypothetical protein
MDPNLRIIQEMRIEHRHDDGTWSAMKPAHHGQPDHDSERSWLRGVIFRCTTCEEEVAVTQGGDEAGAPEARG